MSAEPIPELIAVGDTRVSERGGRDLDRLYSFDTQAAKIKLTCDTHGWTLGPIHDEGFVSAGEPLTRRPKLEAAIRDIEEGRAHVLVVAYRNRLDREPATRDEVINRVEAKGGIVWAADYGQDTNKTPALQFSGTVISAADRMARKEAGVKSREAVAKAIVDGRYPHRGCPLGYRRDNEGRLIVHEAEAKIVHTVFVLRSEDATIPALREYLRGKGYAMSEKSVRRLLVNYAYLGEIHFGTHLPNLHAHEPIVDRVLFEDVKALRIARGPRTVASDQLLARQGVLRCATCNARMVANHRPEGDRYRCPQVSDCPNKAAIVAHIVDDAVRRALEAKAGDLPGEASALDEARAAAEHAEALDARLQKTIKQLIALDVLDEPASQEEVDKLRDEAREARAHAQDLSGLADAAAEHRRLSDDWDLMNLDERRSLIRTFIKSVVITPGVAGPGRINITMVGARR